MSLCVDITKQFKNFSLNIQFNTSDKTTGILGASGCGKSMTLKSIAGIITPDSGRIELNGRVLFDSEKKINLSPQKRRVGYLFQNYALFPNMTVEQNIGAGIQEKRDKKSCRIKEMIDIFHLDGLEKQYPSQLSGGQQQRVALARIMASNAEILLLDEPFSALDYYLKEQLKEQLLEMIRNCKKDVILVTHDRDEAFSLCQDLIIMEQGHRICSGELKDIFDTPKHVVAARLTGCKNISRAKKIAKNELYADDWNMKFFVNQEIPDNLSHIGIRAHYLNAVYKKEGQQNLLKPELLTVMENPFEINLILKNKEGNIETNENKIWWKLSKEQWHSELGCKLPDYIEFPSEHILLLTE